ncbi:MAG TPA: hypothetical protein VFE33_01810 [Thermoanaerobaculia bacterium]|nr:hypothetical protein [Thermoanaerobaculia bacterium]
MRKLCFLVPLLLLSLAPAAGAQAGTPFVLVERGVSPGDSVTLFLQWGNPNCIPTIAPATVADHKVTLHLLPGPGFCPVPPGEDSRTILLVDGLAAGTYTIETEQGGTVLPVFGETSFTVDGASPSRLGLQSGQFQIDVAWTDPASGTMQTAHPTWLSDESGTFWFFDRGNVELTVKILDGRPVNGSYWVFVASMTDVPFTLTVKRHCVGPLPCQGKSYVNPGGRNQNFLDVNAFPN